MRGSALGALYFCAVFGAQFVLLDDLGLTLTSISGLLLLPPGPGPVLVDTKFDID